MLARVRKPVSVTGLQLTKAFPTVGGKVLIRIRAATPPGRGEGIRRLFLRVCPVGVRGARAATIGVSGASIDGRPAILEGETYVAPGVYDLRSVRGEGPLLRFMAPAGDRPIRTICRHKGRLSTYYQTVVILSPRRRVLGSVSAIRMGSCCRNQVLRHRNRSKNPYDLTLVHVLDGSLHLDTGDGVEVVRTGEYILVDPALTSVLAASSPFPVEYRAVIFTQEMLRTARDHLGLDKTMGAFGFDARPRRLSTALRVAVDALSDAADRQEDLGGEWDAALAQKRLLLFLLKNHPSRLKTLWSGRARGGSEDPRILKAVGHLREHLAEPFNIRETARVACVSQPHLRFLFRRALGTSPVRYLQRLRVERAKMMLSSSDMKVTAVARSVGYTDMASFRRLFRRFTSKTPRSFF